MKTKATKTATDCQIKTTNFRPVALVTGGSRGVGAETVLALASRSYDIVLTYRNKAKRASKVAAQARTYGIRALPVCCDITRLEDINQLVTKIREWSGRIDLLVLNASGGLERDLVAEDSQYPMRINRDAQLALLNQTLPLIPVGSGIVFVTSHWAHLYGKVEQPPTYEPIAASKYAGEQALRKRQQVLALKNIRLIVVTGDIVEGTITAKLLVRKAPGLAGQLKEKAKVLPTTTDMGEAIALAATNPKLPNGHTVVVGRALEAIAVSDHRRTTVDRRKQS